MVQKNFIPSFPKLEALIDQTFDLNSIISCLSTEASTAFRMLNDSAGQNEVLRLKEQAQKILKVFNQDFEAWQILMHKQDARGRAPFPRGQNNGRIA